MDKLLSIVIPTYNAENFLDKGLSTFIMDDKDKMDKMEVLIVNDGTPDNSVAVAQKFVDKYPDTFKIINKENGGHGSAINVGVENVTGKFFKCIDADDWVITTALEHMIDFLERADADVVLSSYVDYDISKKRYTSRDIVNRDVNKERIYSLKEIMDMWPDIFNGVQYHGILYNTKFYRDQNYKLTEGIFYEDQEYATIPACKAQKIQLVAEELYVYRVGDVNQSIAAENQLKRLPHFHKVIDSMLRYEPMLEKCPDPEGAKLFWAKKTSMFIGSYYQVALIKSPDKKKYRKTVQKMNARIAEKSPYMFNCVKNKYKVFTWFNKIHMSDGFYNSKFSRFLFNLKRIWKLDKKVYY